MSSQLVRIVPVFSGKRASNHFSLFPSLFSFARSGRFSAELLLFLFLGIFQGDFLKEKSMIPAVWAEEPPLSRKIRNPGEDRPTFTLDQVIQLALSRNPALARDRAKIARDKAQSVEIGELADPKLIMGEQYFPIPFNTTASVLTMTTVGLRQSFSPWGKRALLHQGSVREETSSVKALEDEKSQLVRDVRLSWIDLYRENRTKTLLQSVKSLWKKAFESALTRYRQGVGSESDVLLAQFQKDTIRDQEETLRTGKEETLHHLMRLTRKTHSFRISTETPILPEPLSEAVLLGRLNTHPAIQSKTAKDDAQALRIQVAEKDKIPAFSVEGDYNYFMGPSSITSTPNLFSLVLTMNLPVRPGERQDQKVAEEEHTLEVLQAQREDLRQKLIEQIENAESTYHHLVTRESFLDRVLLPETKRNEAAVLSEYATGKVEVGRVLVAMKGIEEVELQALSLETARMKTMVELSYLAGTVQGDSHDQQQ